MRLTLEKVLILKSVDFFAAAPEADLAAVAAHMRELDAAAGEDIIRQGEPGSTMYLIVSGRVRVHRDGREIAILGAREVFGELSVLDPAPRSGTVTALEPTELLSLSAAPLLETLSEHPEVTRGLFRVLCRRLRSSIGG